MEGSTGTRHDGRHGLAAALHSSLSLDEVENAFFDQVTDMIPADGFGLYRLDAESGGVVSMRAEVGTNFLDDYEEYGRPDDPVLDFVVEQRRPIDSSRVVAPERWDACGARSALAVGGYRHSLEAPVIVSGALFGTINFARRGSRHEFSHDDLVAARFVSEQLGLATERALRFESTGQRAGMLEHVLDRVPQALVVTDLDGRVLFRNRTARKEPWLTLSPDTPAPPDAVAIQTVAGMGGARPHGMPPAIPGPVDTSIGEAIEEFRRDGKRVHTRSLRDQRSGRQVIVKSYRLENEDAAVTLIFNCGQESVDRLPLWDVLSRREQEIAELVSQGLTTKEIADQAFITENTVKQHLKRVFAKTDVRNRAELIQLIWSSGQRPNGAADDRAGRAAG